jgi:hypothetical protein
MRDTDEQGNALLVILRREPGLRPRDQLTEGDRSRAEASCLASARESS